MTSATLKHSLKEASVGRAQASSGRSGGQSLIPSMELLVAITLHHRIAYATQTNLVQSRLICCFILFLFVFVFVTPEGFSTVVADEGLEKARAYLNQVPRALHPLQATPTTCSHCPHILNCIRLIGYDGCRVPGHSPGPSGF